MQYSLKTLMLLAVAMAIVAAFVSKFGGIGLLYGLVLLFVLAIVYCLTRIPLRPALANSLLLCACLMHVSTIYFFYPIAEDWTNEAMYAAADRGYEIQRDEDELHGIALGLGTIIFGYIPIGLFLLFLWLIFFDYWKWTGLTRLLVSLWLLAIPLLVTWLSVRTYSSF